MLGQTPGHRNKRNGDKYAFPHPKPSFRIPFPSLTQTPTKRKRKKEEDEKKKQTNSVACFRRDATDSRQHHCGAASTAARAARTGHKQRRNNSTEGEN
jgi:hypothetical protein